MGETSEKRPRAKAGDEDGRGGQVKKREARGKWEGKYGRGERKIRRGGFE